MKDSRNHVLIDALALEIRARRNELKQTQEDLAGKSTIPRPYISMLEVAKKQASISTLYLLATGLELSLEEFMGRVDKRYKKMLKVNAKEAKAAKAAKTTESSD